MRSFKQVNRSCAFSGNLLESGITCRTCSSSGWLHHPHERIRRLFGPDKYSITAESKAACGVLQSPLKGGGATVRHDPKSSPATLIIKYVRGWQYRTAAVGGRINVAPDLCRLYGFARYSSCRRPISSIGMGLNPSLNAGESCFSRKFSFAASTNPGSPSTRLSLMLK